MPTTCQLQWVCGCALKGNKNKQTRYTGASPIVCLLPNITYLYLHHMCFIFSDLKCYGSSKITLKIQKSIKNISKYYNYPMFKLSANQGIWVQIQHFGGLMWSLRGLIQEVNVLITNGSVGHSPRGAEWEHLIHKNVIYTKFPFQISLIFQNLGKLKLQNKY